MMFTTICVNHLGNKKKSLVLAGSESCVLHCCLPDKCHGYRSAAMPGR